MAEVKVSQLAADEASGTPAEELAQHLINLESAAQANWVRLSDTAAPNFRCKALVENVRQATSEKLSHAKHLGRVTASDNNDQIGKLDAKKCTVWLD